MELLQVSYITEDGGIEVNPKMLPAALRPRIKELVDHLNDEFKSVEKVTRKVRRAVDRTTMRWIRENSKCEYLAFNEGDGTFELIPARLPKRLRPAVPNLVSLMNLAFYNLPDTEESRYHMNLFIEEWIEMQTIYPKDLCQAIFSNLNYQLRKRYGDRPITDELRQEVSEFIIGFFDDLRGEIKNGSGSQIEKPAQEDPGRPDGASESGGSDQVPETEEAGIDRPMSGEGLRPDEPDPGSDYQAGIPAGVNG